MPIVSFDDAAVESFFISGKLKKAAGWSNLTRIAKRKLDMIQYAARLADLRSPPGNHLEELTGRMKGWRSIRINDQWRIIFIWGEDGAHNVKIVDYH